MRHLFHPVPRWALVLLATLTLALVGCGGAQQATQEPTPVFVVITATQPPQPTATVAVLTPEPSPTQTQARATAQRNLNVRSGPGTSYTIVGQIAQGTTLEVVGRNEDGSWWMVLYPPGSGSTAWVYADFTVSENTEEVPVVAAVGAVASGGGQGPSYPAPTAASTSTSPPPTASVGGPSPTSPPPPQATPTATAQASPTPTQSSQTAAADNDSTFNPAISFSLAPTGNRRQFSYSNDVSSPNGDPEDWVEFTTVASENENNYVWVTLTCSGTVSVRADLWDAPTHSQKVGTFVTCGAVDQRISTTSNHTYQFRIFPQGNGYAQYTITVKGVQP